MNFKYEKSKFFGQNLKIYGQILTMLIVLQFFCAMPLWATEITFGITGVVLKEDIANLVHWKRYLSKHSGYDIKLRFLRSYSELKNQFKDQSLDIAFVCGATYVDLIPSKTADLFVVPLVEGKPYYESYVIAKQDTQYDSLESFQGKVYAFSDPESNSGSLVPQFELLQHGYDIKTFFGRIVYTYDHGESIQAVMQDFVDGASVDSMVYKAFVQRNPMKAKQIKIVQKFGPYPIPPVIIQKKVSKEIRTTLRDILLKMHIDPEGSKILSGMGIERFALPGKLNYRKIDHIKFMLESAKR